MTMASRGQAVPGWIRLIVVGGPLALCAYWGVTYSGIYRLLAELQLSTFGAYYMVLTGLVTLLVTLIPSVVLVQILGAYYGARGSANASARHDRSVAWTQRLERAPRRIAALGAGLVLMLFGLYQFGLGLMAGEETSVPIATFSRLEEPASSWVRVEGAYLRWDEAISFQDDRRTRIFVPVDTGAPRTTLFVELSTYEREGNAIELNSGSLPGMLYADGLPGIAREQFSRQGSLADEHWVLDYRDSPEDRYGLGAAFAVSGSSIMIMAALVWMVMNRRGHV